MSMQTNKMRFLASVSLMALGWLAVLPRLAERPRMKSHLDWLQARKIDPSAMYYTELDVMDDILQHQRRANLEPTAERTAY